MTTTAGKPFAYATNTGEVVLAGVLDKYSVKAGDPKSGESRGLKEDDRFNYGTDNLKSPVYNPKALVKLLEKNTYHTTCISAKATDIGGLGVEIQPIGDEADSDNRDKIQAFIDKCFPLMEEVLYREAYDKQTIGYGALELIRYGNLPLAEPERLEHIPAHTIRVHKQGNKYMQTWDGITKRWFKRIGYEKDVHKDTGREFYLGALKPEERATELIFDFSYTPVSTYYGGPDIIPALKTLIGDISAVEYNIYFFKNFGIPDYAIFITGDFVDKEIKDANGNPTGRSEMQNLIEDQMKSIIKDPHSSMVISIPSSDESSGAEVKVQFEKLTVDVRESSFRLYREANRDEIITANKTDPYRIGVLHKGSLGGNLGKESKENYKVSVVLPNQRLLEAYINIYIIKAETGFNIQDWKIKLVSLDTTDEAHEMTLSKDAVFSAGMTPNQFIRKWKDRLGLEEIDHPAMNAHYLNGVPLDYQPKQGEELPVDVLDALKSLQTNLLEVAKKYEAEEQTV